MNASPYQVGLIENSSQSSPTRNYLSQQSDQVATAWNQNISSSLPINPLTMTPNILSAQNHSLSEMNIQTIIIEPKANSQGVEAAEAIRGFFSNDLKLDKSLYNSEFGKKK